mgnify:CR=1 FL=1
MNRTAKKLHEQLGENLNSLQLQVNTLKESLFETEKQLSKKINDIVRQTGVMVQKTQEICQELHPSILGDLGFAAAIDWQLETFEARTGIKCIFIVTNREFQFDKRKAYSLFIVFQEILDNTYLHANASRLKIELCAKHKNLCLKIEDNGRGITEEEVNSPITWNYWNTRACSLFKWNHTLDRKPW